jgi:hypothetical protein
MITVTDTITITITTISITTIAIITIAVIAISLECAHIRPQSVGSEQ